MLGHSVSGCFGILHKALLNPQDEVCAIEPSHYAHLYNTQLLMLESKLVTIPSDPNLDWTPNFDVLKQSITHHTKAIILENPTNPQGVIYSERTLREIINIAGQYNLPILSDETYQQVTFDGLKAKTLPSLAQDVPVIVINSMTKFLMKPGWCVGYAYFHDPEGKMSELERASKLISNTSGFGSTRIPTPIMVAAARTFESSLEDCFQMVKSVEQKRNFTGQLLAEIPGIKFIKPQCALYGLIEIMDIGKQNSPWTTDWDFCLDILKTEGLYFFAGSSYGHSARGYFRTLLYRNLDILKIAYSKLDKYLKMKQ
jgi:aspartate/methionine/tyrosine aminotransferase